jgi:hypothetical protein
MLAVVSAVVAFDRWPGANVQGPVQTLVLDDKAPAIRVSANSNAPSATPARTVAGRVPAGALAPHTTFNSGGVVGQRFASRGVPAPSTGAPVAPPLVPKAPDVPPVPSPDNIVESISNPGTTAGQLADGTQAVTDTAGVSVGRVSPDVGNAVVGGGQQVSQAIREVPLPDHVIPGH